MESPKGKKHRSFSQKEKLKIVQGFLAVHVSSNKYAALHTSKTLDITGQLELRMLKFETDIARLKKGTW